MREESHLSEMRNAIRGDFERLAERRGDQELMRVAEAEDDATADEIAPEAVAELAPVLEVEPQPDPEPEADLEPEFEPDPEEAPERGRSWLARLFSA